MSTSQSPSLAASVVHPRAIGRRVDVRVDPVEVVITLAGKELGRCRRSFAKLRTVTDPEHVRAAQGMRSASIASIWPASDADQVHERDLAVYDRLTGVA